MLISVSQPLILPLIDFEQHIYLRLPFTKSIYCIIDLHEILFLFLRFYLFIHERRRERQRHRQREKQAPRREPDVGLDPRSPGSHPGPKEALNR